MLQGCNSKPEYAKLCQSKPEYARVCQSIPDYARICAGFLNPSDPQREKNTLRPYVIHGIITEMCDIIIYKRGTLSVPNKYGGYPERSEHYEGAGIQHNPHIFVISFGYFDH